ncbi:MAG: AMP-dependent synthetase/ligase [Planctomycetota bacterium]
MTIRTLPDLLRLALSRPRPDLFRFRSDGRWVAVSTAAFGERVEAAARGLRALGVEKGDRVALLSENRLEWAVADLAALSAGAVVVPVYPTLIPEQIAYILRDAEARVLFASTSAQVDKVRAVRDGLPALERVVAFDEADHADVSPLAGLRGAAADPVPVAPDDVATIIYTSGTTGPPKGVVLTHDNIVQDILGVTRVVDITPADSYLSFLPLSHAFERTGGWYAMLYRGARISYAESLDTVARDLREVRPTVVFTVPRMVEKMYERVLAGVRRGGRLAGRVFLWGEEVGRSCAELEVRGGRCGIGARLVRGAADALVYRRLRRRTGGRVRFVVSGGAPLPERLVGFLYTAGLPVLEGYGLTEAAPIVSVNRLDAMRFGSVGKPIPGVEVRIAQDAEVCVRGRSVMKGYYRRPEETAAAIDGEGWLHTGDLGRFDGEGFLHITGRKKDLIVTSGGKKVAPQPIEDRLKRLGPIEEAALIGDGYKYVIALIVPDFRRLERLAAREGVAAADRAALLRDDRIRARFQEAVDEVNAGLSRYERIKKFALLDRPFSVEGGELTPTLKLRRGVIEERFAERIRRLREES